MNSDVCLKYDIKTMIQRIFSINYEQNNTHQADNTLKDLKFLLTESKMMFDKSETHSKNLENDLMVALTFNAIHEQQIEEQEEKYQNVKDQLIKLQRKCKNNESKKLQTANNQIIKLKTKLQKSQKTSIEMKTQLNNKNAALIKAIKQLQTNLDASKIVINGKSNEINMLHRRITQLENTTRKNRNKTLNKKLTISDVINDSENISNRIVQELQDNKMQLQKMKRQITDQNRQIANYKQTQTVLLNFSEKHRDKITELQNAVDNANNVRDKMQCLLIELESDFLKEKEFLRKSHEQEITKLKKQLTRTKKYNNKLETDLRNVISEMLLEEEEFNELQSKYQNKCAKEAELSKNKCGDSFNELEGISDKTKNEN
eukprot:260003_1